MGHAGAASASGAWRGREIRGGECVQCLRGAAANDIAETPTADYANASIATF
jgi:hypothetical protein